MWLVLNIFNKSISEFGFYRLMAKNERTNPSIVAKVKGNPPQPPFLVGGLSYFLLPPAARPLAGGVQGEVLIMPSELLPAT